MAELEQEEMSFWDHLEALRWTLFRSFLALFIFAIGSFAFMRGSDGIFDRVVLAPCYSDFIFYRWLCDLNQWLVNVSPWFDVLPDFCNDNFHVEIGISVLYSHDHLVLVGTCAYFPLSDVGNLEVH